MPRVIKGNNDASGLRFAIVVSRFNETATQGLLDGALATLKKRGANMDDQLVVHVPGGWELPFGVRAVLDEAQVAGVIALGCVIKGDTSQNEYILAELSRALGQLSLEYGVPVAYGVLAPDNLEQALERSGGKSPDRNKGADAADAAIEMARMLQKLRG